MDDTGGRLVDIIASSVYNVRPLCIVFIQGKPRSVLRMAVCCREFPTLLKVSGMENILFDISKM